MAWWCWAAQWSARRRRGCRRRSGRGAPVGGESGPRSAGATGCRWWWRDCHHRGGAGAAVVWQAGRRGRRQAGGRRQRRGDGAVFGGCVGTATLLPPLSSPPERDEGDQTEAHSAITAFRGDACRSDELPLRPHRRIVSQRGRARAPRSCPRSSTMLTIAHTSAATANGSTVGFPPQPPGPAPARKHRWARVRANWDRVSSESHGVRKQTLAHTTDGKANRAARRVRAPR